MRDLYTKHGGILWFLDGMFLSCPNLFGQLYTTHVVYSGEILPLVYVLLPDIKEVTYIKMFQTLKSLKSDFQVQVYMAAFFILVKRFGEKFRIMD